MTKHPFTEDPELAADIYGRRVCRCGLLENNAAHDLPARTDDERRVEARLMGEGGT